MPDMACGTAWSMVADRECRLALWTVPPIGPSFLSSKLGRFGCGAEGTLRLRHPLQPHCMNRAFYLKSEPEWKSGSSQACTEMSGQSQKSAVLISEAIASIFRLAQICIISKFEGRLRSAAQISIDSRVVSSDLKVVADLERSQI